MPQISVIVAVYAAEKYLKKCLDSICNQTFWNIEIILVDDGSVDESGKICDEYAQIDSRIRVFHKENGGVASARQCGLENAIGDFVIHVDPDDWIDSVMLENMYGKAVEETSDVVICDFLQHRKDSSLLVSQKPKSLISSDVMREFFLNLHGSCCNKLIRKNLFERYKISFPLNMVIWEDLFVCVNLMMHDVRISYIPKAYYHYLCSVNENSLVNTVSRKKLHSMLAFIEYFENLAGFDKSLLVVRKIETKRTAFLLQGMGKKEFYEICPDVNTLFVSKFDGFKKIDSLIRFAFMRSWTISRLILFVWKIKHNLF